MVVIAKGSLNLFSNKYPDAESALLKWYHETKEADWKNFSELKNTFNSTDLVGNDRYVFNIKGNQYRLVALIIFKVRTVFILFIGTHSEYDKLNVASVVFKSE